MEKLLAAINLKRKYNNMYLDDAVKEFKQFSNQKIPKDVIIRFKLCGLCNVYLLTSEFLNQYGLKNLFQIQNYNNIIKCK